MSEQFQELPQDCDPHPPPPPLSWQRFPRLSTRALALLAVIGATLIWGRFAVVTKAALADLPPMTVAFARLALAYLILRPLVALSGAHPARGTPPALFGLTGFAAFLPSGPTTVVELTCS